MMKAIDRFCKPRFFACLLTAAAVVAPATGGAGPGIAVIGDSIGEGVQGADAAWQTQVFAYGSWVRVLTGGNLAVPYIATTPFGLVGNTSQRHRLSPNVIGANVAVSGATVNSLLNERPNAASTAEINTEAELVLFPRQQTQIEAIESAAPALVLCWIGNNDVLGTVTSFSSLNASQLTPIADFDRDYVELADRLGALAADHGTIVVFANIPDVTDIAFLVDRDLAESLTGFPVNLPAGHYTTVLTALLMALTGDDTLMSYPNFVLDPAELATIQSRIDVFNGIIQREADRLGMPLVDINARFAELTANPPVFFGRPVTNRFLGGLFSLDGVHPSNLGHALVANEFIHTLNQFYGFNVPPVSDQLLNALYLTEPALDKDLDGKTTGRPGVGLLETIALILGITGDPDDLTPN